jgi:hypothetical protein
VKEKPQIDLTKQILVKPQIQIVIGIDGVEDAPEIVIVALRLLSVAMPEIVAT